MLVTHRISPMCHLVSANYLPSFFLISSILLRSNHFLSCACCTVSVDCCLWVDDLDRCADGRSRSDAERAREDAGGTSSTSLASSRARVSSALVVQSSGPILCLYS